MAVLGVPGLSRLDPGVLPQPAGAHSGATITTDTAVSRKIREGKLRGAGLSPGCGTPPAPPQPRPRYFAVFPARFAAGAVFLAVCAGAFLTASFFAGVFPAAGGTASASAVRSTTESSPPKSLRT